MAAGWAQAGALLTAAGGGGFLQWVLGTPGRNRAARASESKDSVDAWRLLHDAQAADLTDVRNEMRAMRAEHGQERIRCAEQIAALEREVATLSTTVNHLTAQVHEYRTSGTPIALREAGRLVVDGMLAGSETRAWDGTDRRDPKQLTEGEPE